MVLIALGLAMDAFAVSLGAGTHQLVRGWRPAFRLWFHFGLFQSLMTILGWWLGNGLERMIVRFDHWVAFGLLVWVGGRMVKAGMNPEPEACGPNPSRGLNMLSLAVATSIDALAVGVSLGMLKVAIWYPSAVIGVVTALLSLIGIRLGSCLGARFGKRMEIVGGVVLILIAFRIFAVDVAKHGWS